MVQISVLYYVYNVENFLKESLDSLLNQSFHDFEVICVDDGSTDNSLSIIKEYSKRDQRIRVISIDHCGFSKAVNQVMDLTGGKYIYFMSPDSILKFYALGFMFENADEKKTDILLSNLNYQYNNHFINKATMMNNAIEELGGVFNYKDLGNLIFELDASLENKFFASDLIKDNHIRFYDDLDFPENLFFYECLLSSENAFILNDFLFVHRKPLELFKFNNMPLLDVYAEYKLIQRLFMDNKEYKKFEENFLECKINLIMDTYCKIKEDDKERYYKYFRKDLITDFSKNRINNESIENLSDFNRKIFEHILLCESSYEFDLLRKHYFKSMDYNKSLNRLAFLKSVNLKSEID